MSFESCTYVDEILTPLPPSLKNKTDFTKCFAYISSNNTSKFKIPGDLFKYCKSALSFNNCFYNSKLVEIPNGLFSVCRYATDFSSCFNKCTLITSIPEKLFANKVAARDMSFCFYGCTALVSIGANILKGCTLVENLSNFLAFTKVTELQEGIFADLIGLENAKELCFQCTSLETVPYTLFDKCDNLNDVYYAFYNCNKITSRVPPLWEREWEDLSKYHGCYYNCSPENDADIPWIGWSEADD